MTRAQVDRLVLTALTIALVARVPDITVDLLEGSDPVPAWWRPVAGAAVFLLAAVAAVGAVRGWDPARVGTLLVLVTLAALVSYSWVAAGSPSPGTMPWVSMLVPCAVAGAALALPPISAIAVGCALAAVRFAVEGRAEWPASTAHRIDDVAFAMVTSVATVLAVEAAYVVAHRVEAARTASLAAYADAAARRAEEREAHRWDSIVHDSVLATLAVAGRIADDPDTVAHGSAIAERALDQLSGDGREAATTVRDLRARLADEAALLTSRLAFTQIDGDGGVVVPGPVVQAIVDAALEALRNSLEHARSASLDRPVRRTVEMTVTSGALTVVVRDDGSGFEPRLVPSTRLGLQVSVRERMSAVGGSAEILSAPGQGTVVSLRYPAATGTGARATAAHEHLRSLVAGHGGGERLRIATICVAVLWVGMHVCLAVSRLPAARRPVWLLLAVVILVLLSVWGMSPLVTRRRAMSLSAALVFAVATGLFGLLVDPLADGGRTAGSWMPGAIGALVAVLVLRDRLGSAVLATVLGTGVVLDSFVMGGQRHASGRLSTAVLAAALPAAWLAASWSCREIANRSSRTVAGYWSTEAQAEVRSAEARRATELAALRRAELSELARPLLERIAAGGRLDDDLRARCRAVEQLLRDDLTARALVDARVREAVQSARGRGVAVSLRDDRRLGPVQTPDPRSNGGVVSTATRAFVARALDRVETGSVTVRVPPDGDRLTFVVVEPDADEGVARPRTCSDRGAGSLLAAQLVALAERLELGVEVDAGDQDLLATVRPSL